MSGLDINGVAHVIFRVDRIAECIAFYDQLMPFLGLQPVEPRSDDFVYYVGGRTALAIRRADPEHAGVEHVETAPGLDHLCFRARRREDVDSLYAFLQEIGADMVRAPEDGPWAPGYYSLSFRDPEGIRLEVNHVPGRGLLDQGAAFTPAPDHPITGRPREAQIRRYWEHSSGDQDIAHEIYHDDAVLEFPQSGERFEGVANFKEWRSQYPAGVTLEMRELRGRGDLWVVEGSIRYDGGPPQPVVNVLEFRDDKVARETIYVTEPWEPPEWRAGWRAAP